MAQDDVDVGGLLAELALTHLADQLAGETASAWLQLDRLALLQRLKDKGVHALSERQRLANGIGRKRREMALPLVPSAQPLKRGAESLPSRSPPPPRPPPRRPTSPVFSSDAATDRALRGAFAAPSDEARAHVRRMVLSGAGGYELRDGYVRVKRFGSLSSVTEWTSNLGECGDSNCGCYRLSESAASRLARPKFRNAVVTRTHAWFTQQQQQRQGRPPEEDDDARQRGGPEGIRYVSIGCGSLLTDFEILCGLQERGLPIEAVTLCDTVYGAHAPNLAVQTLADFFWPARVAAFDSLSTLRHAAEEEPGRYGRASVFVHCDAADISKPQSHGLASLLLAPGAYWFQLSNSGRHSHSREGFQRRRDDATTTPARPSAADEMVSVVLSHLEGEQPLLGTRELSAATGERIFRVVHGASVVVRSRPTREAGVVGIRAPGTEVLVAADDEVTTTVLAQPAAGRDEAEDWSQTLAAGPSHVRERWVRLSAYDSSGDSRTGASDGGTKRDAWMLCDGAAIGLGPLLAEVAMRATPPPRSAGGAGAPRLACFRQLCENCTEEETSLDATAAHVARARPLLHANDASCGGTKEAAGPTSSTASIGQQRRGLHLQDDDVASDADDFEMF